MSQYVSMEKQKQSKKDLKRVFSDQSQSYLASGISNSAMLAMLNDQEDLPRPSGGQPLAAALRQKFEQRFQLPLDDVRIHWNSDEPAKFHAGAITYGKDIMIGPGRDDLLEHEMGHIPQQMLGQVKPTGMEHGVPVNRSPALEHNADTGMVSPQMGVATGLVVQCGGSEDEDEDEDMYKCDCDDFIDDPDYLISPNKPKNLRQALYGGFRPSRYLKFRQTSKEKNAVCEICGEPIDYTLPFLDHKSFTIDHKKPVVRHFNSKGYRQSFAERRRWYNKMKNWAPAHRSCNSIKSGYGEHFIEECVGRALHNEEDIDRYSSYCTSGWCLFAHKNPPMQTRQRLKKLAQFLSEAYGRKVTKEEVIDLLQGRQ